MLPLISCPGVRPIKPTCVYMPFTPPHTWGSGSLGHVYLSNSFVISPPGAALGGNLGGVTSRLLALDGGQLAGRARLDVIIPVAGFSRCADYENGYGATACLNVVEPAELRKYYGVPLPTCIRSLI